MKKVKKRDKKYFGKMLKKEKIENKKKEERIVVLWYSQRS